MQTNPLAKGNMRANERILPSAILTIDETIAEGFNHSKKEYLNSLDIGRGEADETENWLCKVRDAGFIDRNTANNRIRECIEIEKMLNGLMRSIRDSDT
jgi:four helix bundle protein